ncbi:hypothetical protein BCV69DRAFT_284280 [Microstroma glucosiphilum]|uniref:CCD97-like C-terminal domain-containing protein n=1 Tax=Pseudomicrostroma glucosiphilum TaxID=1684307 RepID=A0A316U142_9BASI|nr:hypothetical protein BCV69DRAFT_284280 [Pseudomicrostroma glucosiphilum]PWN19122.1 hypothetical protein BCV69DRAFT_284280 [Pseudomicrostroma glucosiphilum]
MLYSLMTSSLKESSSSSSGTLDERYWSALGAWLDVERSSLPSLRAQVQSQPLQFLTQNIPRLPEHLLRPQAALTTPQQRANISLIRQRRRCHAELRKPEELEVRGSRRRLGRLWKVIVGKQTEPAVKKEKADEDEDLDPAFPGVPDLSNLPNVGANGVKLPRYGPLHQGELFTNPRLARLLDEQDEEEAQLSAAEQEEEEEEEEDDVEDDEEMGNGAEVDEEDVEAFRIAVLDRFIRGDPTLNPSIYAAIDFDESLDPASANEDGAGSREGLAFDVSRGTAAQAALERERLDEDSYFDDEDES